MRHWINILLLLSMNASAQNNQDDSLHHYISNLNWNSAIVFAGSYIPKIEFDRNAEWLIKTKYPKVEIQLSNVIDDTTKTVAAHIILTRRYRINTSLHDSMIYENNSAKGVYYKYNGVEWYYDLTSGKSSITPEVVKYVQEYWRKKMKKGKRNRQ